MTTEAIQNTETDNSTQARDVLLRVMDAAEQQLMQERRSAFEVVFGGDYMRRFTDPILFKDARFQNYRIRKFYEHNFSFMSRNLFADYVYRRRAGFSRDLLTKFSDLMARKLDGAAKLLTRHNDQVSHILEVNNYDATAIGYMSVTYHMVPVIHAQARQYLELLLEADKLFTNVAAATMEGLIDPSEKTKIEQKTILTLRAIGNTIRSETITLRKEAQRLQSEQTKAGVKEDVELQTAIEMQSSAIEEASVIERVNEQLDGASFKQHPDIESDVKA